jgi:competence protein ComEC
MNGAQVGDLISTRATLMPLPEPTIPGGYDFELRFYFEGVGGLGYSLKDLTVITEEKRFFRNKISHLRTKIYAEIIKILGKKVGNIASALMIGEYTAIDAKILSDMRIAGISHILSVSGMHLSLVAAIFFFTTRIILCLLHRATYRLDAKKIAAVIAIIGSFAYLLISGLQIAAVRSFIMTAMVIFAIIIDRTATPMRSIAWAAFVILLFQPESIINPSFQMSFSAVIALIACFEYYQQLLPTAYNNKSIFSRILYYGASSIISSLVAGLATTPFIIYHFNQYSYYGVLSNLLAVPITSFIIMPCVILAFLFYPFGVMKWALIPMGYGISGLIYIADIIAKLPYAQKLTDTMPSLSLFIIVSGGLWLCLWRSKIRLVGLGIIACGLGLYFITPSPNIIIDSKSKVVAFITNNKIYFTSKKISKFSKEGILHSVGKEDFTVLDKNNLPSDISIKNGILYFKHNKHLVAIIDDKLNKQKQITVSNFSSCIDADLIINLTLLNAPSCRVNLQQITLSNLTNNGSYKVFLGTSVIFENVVSSRGKRFWIR